MPLKWRNPFTSASIGEETNATGMRSPTIHWTEPTAAHSDVGAVGDGMLRACRTFPGQPGSVGQARRFLCQVLPEDCEAVAESLALMLSELATNAVQHAETEFEVAVELTEGGRSVRVSVTDTAEGFPTPETAGPDAPRGRGLQIVGSLADAWGVELHRDPPAKTVWFSSTLPPLPGLPIALPTSVPMHWEARTMLDKHEDARDKLDPSGSSALVVSPAAGVFSVLDELRDAVVATDAQGEIRYANEAAENLMGWPPGSLVGRSVLDIVGDSGTAPLEEGFGNFVRGRAPELLGQRLPAVIKRADGSEVDTELVLSMVEDDAAGPMMVGIFRPHDDRKLQRWSQLTNELLEIMQDAPIDDPPAERLLSTLGRRLGWDMTALWTVTPSHELVCHNVWARDSDLTVDAGASGDNIGAGAGVGGDVGAGDRVHEDPPTSCGSERLARLVIEQGQPLWIPDVSEDPRCADDALAPQGLRSVYAFPILYRGACVGVVELLSGELRQRDRSVVDLMDAVAGHLGELLHASALQAERQGLVEELLEARRRSEFLLLAAQVLADFVDYGEMIERLAQVSVPVLADLCLIDLEDDDKQMRRMAAWHADPAKRPLAEELRKWYAPLVLSHDPIMQVMRTGHSMWSADMSDQFLRETSRDKRHYSILKELGYTSYMTVPLRTRDGEVIGTVSLVSCGSGRRFSEKDLDLAEQLAKQVGSVVSRARAYDRERRISHELQRNLLPDVIPAVGGWDVAARYRPASGGHEVGGDWYDVVPVTDDLVALVVGDVEGHDLNAAKTMSYLRRTLGMLLLEERSPGQALERLNQFCLLGAEQRLATALVGMLDRSSGVISFSSAGHPPPMHIASRGRAMELLVPPAPPLGVQPCRYKDHTFLLDDGCLVMFTDGLIERRGIHFSDRLAALESSLGATPDDDPALVADFVIDAMTSEGRSADDIVVLTARRRQAEKSAAVLS